VSVGGVVFFFFSVCIVGNVMEITFGKNVEKARGKNSRQSVEE